jgi:hypothetical protein
MSATFHSGGCQCGAVRFRASKFGRSSLCHCRMCQKAFGSFFGALVTAHDVEWTRGTATHSRSSNVARRGFCPDCGTPLTFEYDGFSTELAVGAFDDPSVAAPVIQVNPLDKLPIFEKLCTLPVRPDGAEPKADEINTRVENYQHPDHDTAKWTPRRAP